MAEPCPPHATLRTFGYPQGLVGETGHWAVLLRPKQLTPGSLVVISKSDATAFGALPDGAHAELATVTARVEALLLESIGHERINWIMLMMVDPHVHFHVFPRFSGTKTLWGLTWVDSGWPGPPDLSLAQAPETSLFESMLATLRTAWDGSVAARHIRAT